MKNKKKLICAFWVICIPSVVLVETLVQSESYKQINTADFSFSLVNLALVQNELRCFRHCNSDDNCRGVGLVEETGEKKG